MPTLPFIIRKHIKPLLTFAYDPIGFLQELSDAQQPNQPNDIIQFQLLHQKCYLINNSIYIKQLFQHPEVFRKDSIDFHVFKQTLGNGLLVSQGEDWKRHRQLIQPMLSRKQAHACSTLITQATQEMCLNWQTKEEPTINIWQESKKLTLRIVGMALFNHDPNQSDIGEHFTAIEKYIVELFRIPIPLPKWIPIPQNRRLQKAQKGLSKSIASMKKENMTEHAEEDILTKLIQAQNENKEITDEQVRDEIVTLLFAGHETTAAALVWCCYALVTYPDSANKLYSEIDLVLKNRRPSAADLSSLTYTKNFVEETLRLWPPASFTNRMIKEDTQLGPYHLKKHSLCFVSAFTTQRSSLYFPNPEQFQPERFAVNQSERPTYSYFPFGGGPHICIGMQLALTELVLSLATIAQQFHFERTTNEPIIPKMQPSLRPIKLELKIKARKQ